MEMLSPRPEQLPASGSSGLQRLIYALLALMLVGGASIRFNDRLAALSPGLASPVSQRLNEAALLAGLPKALAELTMLSPGAEPGALAGMGLPREEVVALAADLRRHRIRLVRVPLFDAGGAGPHAVLVSTGGYSRLVPLSRTPTVLTLPIDRIGTISFQAPAPPGTGASDPVGVGMVTLAGPLRLPDLAAGQRLDVGVIAQ